MFNWRHASAGLHRSVHTASTAWTLSWALCDSVGGRFFFSVVGVVVLVEVIGKFLFLVVVLITDAEFEFALLGAEHDGLAVHAPDHVERRLRFAAQGQLQEVLLNAGLDGLAEFGLDLEEAVSRAQSFDALIGPLVVVMFDPDFDAFAGGLERIELGAHEEVLPDGGPEALHLAERHRMLRPRLEVLHAILLQHRFEAASAAPSGILPAVVGQHLFGRLILADGHAIHFNHRCRRGAAEQIRSHDEPRVIIHEGDEVGVTSAQPEREDVRLPHLIGRGPLKEPGPDHVPLLDRRRIGHQIGGMQPLAHRLRAGRQQEPPTQHLADSLDAERGILPLQLNDLLSDGFGEFGGAFAGLPRLQPGFSLLPIPADPVAQTTVSHAHLVADLLQAEPFLQAQPDRLEFFGDGITAHFFRAASPPRGAVPLLLY